MLEQTVCTPFNGFKQCRRALHTLGPQAGFLDLVFPLWEEGGREADWIPACTTPWLGAPGKVILDALSCNWPLVKGATK